MLRLPLGASEGPVTTAADVVAPQIGSTEIILKVVQAL